MCAAPETNTPCVLHQRPTADTSSTHTHSPPLQIRRPHDYNLQHARTLGPVEGDPTLDLRLIKIANTLADSGAAHLIISNWQHGTSTEQARELLQQYGTVRGCAMRADNSCYCEYVDPHITDVALAQVDGMQYGGGVLVARKVAPSAEAATALQQLIDQQQAKLAQKQFSALGLKMPVMPQHAQLAQRQAQQAQQQAQQAQQQAEEKRNSCVVKLDCMVEREELLEEEDYEEILEDTREEVAKYGKLRKVAIPRPAKDQGALLLLALVLRWCHRAVAIVLWPSWMRGRCGVGCSRVLCGVVALLMLGACVHALDRCTLTAEQHCQHPGSSS
jgi:hypothetical protein